MVRDCVAFILQFYGPLRRCQVVAGAFSFTGPLWLNHFCDARQDIRLTTRSVENLGSGPPCRLAMLLNLFSNLLESRIGLVEDLGPILHCKSAISFDISQDTT